jgi:hypothetical protein
MRSIDAAPEGGISSKVLRDLGVGVLEDARSIFEEDDSSLIFLERFGFDPSASVDVISRRSNRTPDLVLAKVAQVYSEASNAPRQAVARRLSYSEPQASDLIRKARDRGFLTGGGQRGRAGGTVTDKACRLLADQTGADYQTEAESAR